MNMNEWKEANVKGKLIVLIPAVAWVCGCTGPLVEGTIFEHKPRPDPEVSRIAVDTRQMSVEFRQLSEQISVLNRNQELLEARLNRLEAAQTAQTATGPKTSQEDITALRRDIQLLRAERETMRNEIVSDLAGRIESIAARQQADINSAKVAAAASAAANRGGGAAASGDGAAARTGSGYEHKVERGQTLSEIARGYGKSVESIMKANKITNPSTIRVGQVLFIPD